MSSRRGVVLDVAAALLLGAALAAAYAGPLRFELADMSLSIRNVARPLLAAAAVLAVRVWLRRTRRGADTEHVAVSGTRVLAGALIAAGMIGWIAYLSATVGGADSYGYVSAADRVRARALIQGEPLAAVLPFEHGIAAACPLGYVPAAASRDACAPAYPLGLPVLMAIATFLFGAAGAFIVPPLMGVVLVVATYSLAAAWFRDRVIAVAAAALVTLHPLVFTYAIQPMSDVPAAAFLTLAVLGLCADRQRPLLAGLAAAMALFIRPALAPAALALVFMAGPRGPIRGPMRYAIPVVLAIIAQAMSQQYLYGSAGASGYGSITDLFSFERVVVNARSYGYWATASLGVVAIAAGVIGLVTSNRTARIAFLLIAACVCGPYLFYRTYDHWETLRFLLPAIVLFTIFTAAGVCAVGRRVAGEANGGLVAAVIVGAIAWSGIGWLEANNVFTMPAHEARHRLAAEMVARSTPPDAVILALQHSGSLRYYAQRQTVNWDQIPAGRLPATVEALKKLNRRVYVMTDSDAERNQFQKRHGPVLQAEGWLPAGQRRDVQLYEAPERP